jgi:hypothetical protein
MRGICNNKHHCHCNYGWAPPMCLKLGSGGSVDSGPPPQRTKKYEWIFKLLFASIIVLLLCVSLLIWILSKKDKSHEGKMKNITIIPKQNVETSPTKEEENVETSPKQREVHVETSPKQREEKFETLKRSKSKMSKRFSRKSRKSTRHL